jgi:hypothetical protein
MTFYVKIKSVVIRDVPPSSGYNERSSEKSVAFFQFVDITFAEDEGNIAVSKHRDPTAQWHHLVSQEKVVFMLEYSPFRNSQYIHVFSGIRVVKSETSYKAGKILFSSCYRTRNKACVYIIWVYTPFSLVQGHSSVTCLTNIPLKKLQVNNTSKFYVITYVLLVSLMCDTLMMITRVTETCQCNK